MNWTKRGRDNCTFHPLGAHLTPCWEAAEVRSHTVQSSGTGGYSTMNKRSAVVVSALLIVLLMGGAFMLARGMTHPVVPAAAKTSQTTHKNTAHKKIHTHKKTHKKTHAHKKSQA